MSASGEVSSNTEQVQKALKEHTKNNIDEYIRVSTFSDEKVDDVSVWSLEYQSSLH